MGREDHQGPRRDLLDGLHGDRALAFQVIHDVGVVDDLVLDVHGRAEPLQANLHHLDGPHNTGAETAGRTQGYLHLQPPLRTLMTIRVPWAWIPAKAGMTGGPWE